MPRFDIYREGTCERAFELVESGVVVGRDPTADLVLEDPRVSRHHALVVREADGLWARDLSTNTPMLVNGLPCDEKHLRHGDRLGFGSLTLQFVDDGADVPVSEAKPALPQKSDPNDTEVLGRSQATKLQYVAMQRMRPHFIIRPAADEDEDDEPQGDGEFFAINCALVSIGSDANCVLKLDQLPDRALLVYRSQLAHRIRVLDEELGITVTGWKVRDAALRDGDIIQVGDWALEYREGAPNS